MNRTAIDWTDFTWNPVVGCTHGCSWCYARRMAARDLSGCPDCKEFRPHLHPERLGQPAERKKGADVFSVSMGDLFDPEVKAEWQAEVFAAMAACPQHRFAVLTKRPDRILPGEVPDLPNLLLGVSVTGEADGWRVQELQVRVGARRFVSFEPLQASCERVSLEALSWVIVGAETGNHKGRVTPALEWIADLRDRAGALGIPVFEKANLGLGAEALQERARCGSAVPTLL